MKNLPRFLLITLLVVFTSCQDEGVDEPQEQQAKLRFIDGNVVSDGEEDKNLIFTKESENLVQVGNAQIKSSSDNCIPDIEGLESMLPNEVTVTTTAKPGNDAYFNLSISDETGFLTGSEIPAWCADQDLSLDNNETALFQVYSSLEALPADKFEFPENFDKVNWILNQDLIGTESPNGFGQYTFGHIQYAIWLLVDDSVCQVCTFLTDPTGNWNSDGRDVTMAEEIRDLALSQGQGFSPGCGDLMAIILVPDGKQSVIITKEVEETPCDDCYGKVTDLTLKWNWHNDHRVRVYQRQGNSWHAIKIFDQVVGEDDHIVLDGANNNGTFGKWVYVFVGNCYYTKFRTDCHLNIGPGYRRGVLEVVEGMSSQGGELCEYEPPHHWCWWW